MSFTLLPPPQESVHILIALPAMNGPLPAELKSRENADNGSYTMMAKPIRALELHYPMIQFFIIERKSVTSCYHGSKISG